MQIHWIELERGDRCPWRGSNGSGAGRGRTCGVRCRLSGGRFQTPPPKPPRTAVHFNFFDRQAATPPKIAMALRAVLRAGVCGGRRTVVMPIARGLSMPPPPPPPAAPMVADIPLIPVDLPRVTEKGSETDVRPSPPDLPVITAAVVSSNESECRPLSPFSRSNFGGPPTEVLPKIPILVRRGSVGSHKVSLAPPPLCSGELDV